LGDDLLDESLVFGRGSSGRFGDELGDRSRHCLFCSLEIFF
jgi:hypothetical protein